MVSRSLLAGLAFYAGFPAIVESQAMSDSKIAASTITDGNLISPPFLQLAVDHASHSNTIKGAVMGATVGAAIGALIGYQQAHRSSVKDHSEDGRVYFVIISEGAIIGAILGGLIGRHR